MPVNYQHAPGRIFVKNPEGKLLAEIKFPMTEEGTADFTATFVDPSLRGQGVGDQLVRAAIAESKKRGVKVIATCSYVKAWFEKHPEEADLLADRKAED